MKATLEHLYLEYFLRKRANSSIIWTTKEGKNIPINEMSDAHLVNTINMLLRNEAKAEEEEEEKAEIMDHIGDYDIMIDQYLKD